MAGMFDDLVPSGGGDRTSSLSFEDLVRPKPAARPMKAKGAEREAYGAGFNLFRSVPLMDEGAAALGAVGRVVTGQNPIKAPSQWAVVNAFGDAYKAARGDQNAYADDFEKRRPLVTTGIKTAGTGATMLVPGGAQAQAFAQGSRATNVARGVTQAAGTAYLYGATDRGSLKERAQAGNAAATNPFVLSLGAVGGAIAPAAKRQPAPRKVSPDVALLAKEGVQMTPGQMGGRLKRSAEDAGTSLPFVGEAIGARRTEGVQTFNRAVINRAMREIGEELPADLVAGTEAVKHAGDRISRGYEEAIPSRVVRADPGFADDVRAALVNVSTMTPKAQSQLQNILNQRVTARLPANGAMDGRLYKQMQSELDYEAARFGGSGDADQRAIGEAIVGVQKAIEGAARRQDPAFGARIDALDRAWAELARLESAAAKSDDLSGVFTPKQYAGATRAGDGRVRKRGVARGEALSQDLAGAGVRVLPSKMPDSGSAGRAAWGMVASAPGAVVGAITGGGVGALAGIGGTAATLAALSRRYTPEAVRAANVALTQSAPGPARDAALKELAEIAARNPKAAELYREVAAKLSTVAGAAGGQQGRNLFAQPGGVSSN